MRKASINIEPKEHSTDFVINMPKSPFIIRFVLVFFATVGFVFPILVVVLASINGTKIGFGILFSFLIGFGVGIYLTRLILWNTYGSEHIKISSLGLEYYCDYRLFKDNRKHLKLKNLFFQKANTNMMMKNNDETINTSITLSDKMLDELIDNIQNEVEKFN